MSTRDPGEVAADQHDESAALPMDARSASLIAHIQGVMEHQKAVLAREMHDELGGLLVGAAMDLAWAEQHIATSPAELRLKLVRARQTLASAIDLKRKLIEELRPTLLDNVGLFAALRWHTQAACKRAGMSCRLTIPEEELRFAPNIPIALFRVVQEMLSVIIERKPGAPIGVSLTLDPKMLVVDIQSDAAAGRSGGAEVHYLAAIEQRVAALGGQLEHAGEPARTRMMARFPRDGMLA